MPELPEVETIRIGLTSKIIGLRIKRIQILNQKSFIGDPKQIIGAKIKNIWRRAKILGIDLSNTSLLIHLKMSGQIIVVPAKAMSADRQAGIQKKWIPDLVRDDKNRSRFIGGHPTHDMLGQLPNKSTRVIFEFNNGSKLYFNDQRKFGWIKLVNSSELMVDSFLKNLGPEPLEKAFNWEILKTNLLKHKSQSVKVALLDQTIISGLGNIYVCEALFNARINPKTKVSAIADGQYKKIHQGIIKALKDGIKYGGSTKTNFVNSDGKKGYFLDYSFVYGRVGDKCKICGNLIQKIKLAGRGTFFCPYCQS